MFREGIRFLRAYFTFSGLLGIFLSVSYLLEPQQSIINSVFGLVALGLSTAWVYVGLSFRRLLVTSAKAILMLLVIGMAFRILYFLVNLLNGVEDDEVVLLVFGLLVDCYLFYNIKCLSAEEKLKQ